VASAEGLSPAGEFNVSSLGSANALGGAGALGYGAR
jgi:hypothetical protein